MNKRDLSFSTRDLGRSAGALLPTVLFALTALACGAVGFYAVPGLAPPTERRVTIRAHQYGYDPPVLRVNQGDSIRLRLISADVVHGFYLEGHDLDATAIPLRTTFEVRRPSAPGTRELVEEHAFTAEKTGKFRYRCSQTCGFLHPFMLGELIVEPNRLLGVGWGLGFGVLLGGFLAVWLRKDHR